MGEPNFLLDSRDRMAPPPSWPCFRCENPNPGELSGYAWHPDPSQRECFGGGRELLADPRLVAALFVGRPIERAIALRSLIKSDPLDTSTTLKMALFERIFPRRCEHCGANHSSGEGGKWRRVALAIHPAAIELLRKADPSRHRLTNLDIHEVGSPRRERLVEAPGLPAPKDPAERLKAQTLWAFELIAEVNGDEEARALRKRRRRRRRLYTDTDLKEVVREAMRELGSEGTK